MRNAMVYVKPGTRQKGVRTVRVQVEEIPHEPQTIKVLVWPAKGGRKK